MKKKYVRLDYEMKLCFPNISTMQQISVRMNHQYSMTFPAKNLKTQIDLVVTRFLQNNLNAQIELDMQLRGGGAIFDKATKKEDTLPKNCTLIKVHHQKNPH
mmetsp:Transcript_18943/g.43165  ORF Transcript_18943/g.43165 Transcript_18943/m.43165 type:complete len:102 (-) Transcript_18943:163-468(-)